MFKPLSPAPCLDARRLASGFPHAAALRRVKSVPPVHSFPLRSVAERLLSAGADHSILSTRTTFPDGTSACSCLVAR